MIPLGFSSFLTDFDAQLKYVIIEKNNSLLRIQSYPEVYKFEP